MLIRILQADDAQVYQNLRLEALATSPDFFGSTFEREASFSIETVRERLAPQQDKFTLGAFTEQSLVGIVTFVRESGAKIFHKGNIFGMFVTAAMRGQGVGRALLVDLISRAQALDGLEQINLTVVTSNDSAKRLYQSVGFECYGLEVHALKHDDRYADEELMVRYIN